MIRSLYTGISGLRAHQTMMDVTGNNIANVNTTGYKTANTVFEDTLSQTLSNATAPQGQQGGSNPAQVGLGVRVAGISTNFSQGATQTTGRNTDMLISGDGFFTVRQNGVNQYTRSGAFSIDATGALVSTSGAQVMGWMANDGVVSTTGVTTPVSIPAGLLVDAEATEKMVVSGNLNNSYLDAPDPVTFSYPVYDSQGNSSDVKLTMTPSKPAGTAATTTEWGVSGSYTGKTGTTETFTAKLARVTDATTGKSTWTTTPVATNAETKAPLPGVTTFTGLTSADGSKFDINVDFNKLTSTASPGSAKVESQDGSTAATLSSWKLGSDGTITGIFSNGKSSTLAKIAVATFNNPSGLEKQGGSQYSATVNSGDPSVGSPGDSGRGTLVSGALEMSNVDLAQEFTNLIVSQRGFQANSRLITTSDSMLEELVNLKR